MKLRCAHCNHEWWPRTEQPKRCPRCQRKDYAAKLPRLLNKPERKA